MNKIYRVYRNASGKYVVASERTKSRKKGASVGQAAAIGVLAIGAVSAHAACGINPQITTTTNLECQPAIGNADLTTSAGTVITSSSGPAAVFSRSPTSEDTSTATVTIQDTTITKLGGSQGVAANGLGGAAVNIVGVNKITVADSGDTAVIASSLLGNASINVTGDLAILNNVDNADHNDGLEANAYASNASATVMHIGGGVVTTYGGNAILVTGNGASTTATADIGNGAVLEVKNATSGAAGFVNSGIKVRTVDGLATVRSAATVKSMGDNSHGIFVSTANGVIQVANDGKISTDGVDSKGIRAETSAGDISITSSGSISTTGNSGHGISANTNGGNIQIHNTGSIQTGGLLADGISATAGNGETTVSNSGQIHVTGSNPGSNVHGGIVATSSGGDVTINQAGSIIIDDSLGGIAAFERGALIYGTSGGAGTINMSGGSVINSGTHVAAHGLEVDTNSSGTATINVAGGSVQANGGDGLVIQAGGLAASTGNVRVITAVGTAVSSTQQTGIFASGASAAAGTLVEVISQSEVAAGRFGILANGRLGAPVKVQQIGGSITSGSYGINATSTGNGVTDTGSVSVFNSGSIHTTGVSNAAGILAQSSGTTSAGPVLVTNAGSIDAMSDAAIVANATAQSSVEIFNSGAMIGSVMVQDSQATAVNSGTWALRKWVDTTGSGVRDTLAVAVSDFGTNAHNTVTNSGTLSLLGGTAANVDATGGYSTGYAANTMASGGAVQGHILGVKTFTNSGTIDLSANPAAGDILLITGGHQAGLAGGGTFVSNGGTLKLDAVLNEGGANSQSDVLVVDRAAVGAGGATSIKVNNIAGAGALTVGNGIELVRVLEEGQSAVGAFVLNGRAVAGAYDYLLHQGSETDASDGNWYLRNTAPDEPDQGSGANGDGGHVSDGDSVNAAPGTPLYRPETGAYLANQSAAIGMFNVTLHDRLGEPNFAETTHAANDKPMAGWARLQGRKTDSMASNRQLDMNTDSWVLQGGLELGRWNTADGRFHTGVMFGTGSATTDVSSNVTSYKAAGKVNGNSVGLYGTWYADASKPTGLYVDGWLQRGRYDNEVQGQYLSPERYNSTTLAGSIEAGYAFEMSNDGRRAIYLEPQAQVIYSKYDADRHAEANGTVVRGAETGGLLTRLGARFYGHEVGKEEKFQPFVEANWWHASRNNAITMNMERVAQDLPGDTFEFKVGAEAELGKGWASWGHLGLQKGRNDYKSIDALIGVKYTW